MNTVLIFKIHLPFFAFTPSHSDNCCFYFFSFLPNYFHANTTETLSSTALLWMEAILVEGCKDPAIMVVGVGGVEWVLEAVG